MTHILAPTLALLALVGSQAAAEAPFEVEAVTSTIGAGEAIGRVRAGLLCLPKGPLRWREVAGAGVDQKAVVGEALAAAGLAVASFARERAAGRPIRGVITQAGFDLCARDWGRGRHDALSGKAALAVTWWVAASAGQSDLTHVSRIEQVVARDRAKPATAIYRDLLGDAARDLAGWLKDAH